MSAPDQVDYERLRAECEEQRREQWARERADWIASLDPKDWLLDGGPVKGYALDQWNALDWSRAWMDMGFSPAGNPGPYWHVPCMLDPEDETVKRLYPKVLRTKWLSTIRQAVAEAWVKEDPR